MDRSRSSVDSGFGEEQAIARLSELCRAGEAERAKNLAIDHLTQTGFAPKGVLAIVKPFEETLNFHAAVSILDAALDHHPADEALLIKASDASKNAGQYEDAIYFLELALHHNPASGVAAHQLSETLAARGETRAAQRIAAAAVDRGASEPSLLLHYAQLLKADQRYDEAVTFLERVLAEHPDDVRCLAELSVVLTFSQRNHEAIEIFESLKSHMNPVLADMAIASAHFQIGNFDLARQIYEKCLTYRPHHFHTRLNMSMLRLLHAEFEQAWDDYIYRYHTDTVSQRLFPFEWWDGQAMPTGTLLVFGEQGLGDEIMFASCFADVLPKVGHCVIECEPRLKRLFERSFASATIVTTPHKELLPDWLQPSIKIEKQIAAGSLPALFRRGWQEFPQHSGYLKADPGRVEYWRSRISELGPGRKIGISWRGGTVKTRTGARTIPLDLWDPFFRNAGDCVFVSLQYGKETPNELAALPPTHPRIHHFQEAIDDYDETAALVTALDGVVTVCTSIVHLTGALGRLALVLVPTAPEWRYLRHGAAMPWYPSVELVRQQVPGQWQEPLAWAGDKIGQSSD